MTALILGSIGSVALASEGDRDDRDRHDEKFDRISEIRMDVAEEAADLRSDIVMAQAEGDFEKVADLKAKLVELSAEKAEKIADEIADAREDMFDDED